MDDFKLIVVAWHGFISYIPMFWLMNNSNKFQVLIFPVFTMDRIYDETTLTDIGIDNKEEIYLQIDKTWADLN